MKALASFLLSLLLAAGSLTPVAAQVELTVTPAMVRGPAGAPLTIVEFFDFE
jgi:protein-disulfide isomerase